MSFGGASQGTIRYQLIIDDAQANQKIGTFKNSLTQLAPATANVNKEMGALANNFKGATGGLTQQNTLIGQMTQQHKSLGTQIANSSARFSTLAIGISATASSALSLAAGFRDYNDAQIQVERVTRRLSLAHETLTKAQDKLNKLQASGVKSGKDYQQAQLDVQQAQQQVDIQTQLLGESQERLFDSQTQFVVSIVPTVIGAVGTLGAAWKELGVSFSGIGGKFSAFKNMLTTLVPSLFATAGGATAAGVGGTAMGGGMETAAAGTKSLSTALGFIAAPLAAVFLGFTVGDAILKKSEAQFDAYTKSFGDNVKKLTGFDEIRLNIQALFGDKQAKAQLDQLNKLKLAVQKLNDEMLHADGPKSLADLMVMSDKEFAQLVEHVKQNSPQLAKQLQDAFGAGGGAKAIEDLGNAAQIAAPKLDAFGKSTASAFNASIVSNIKNTSAAIKDAIFQTEGIASQDSVLNQTMQMLTRNGVDFNKTWEDTQKTLKDNKQVLMELWLEIGDSSIVIPEATKNVDDLNKSMEAWKATVEEFRQTKLDVASIFGFDKKISSDNIFKKMVSDLPKQLEKNLKGTIKANFQIQETEAGVKKFIESFLTTSKNLPGQYFFNPNLRADKKTAIAYGKDVLKQIKDIPDTDTKAAGTQLAKAISKGNMGDIVQAITNVLKTLNPDDVPPIPVYVVPKPNPNQKPIPVPATAVFDPSAGSGFGHGGTAGTILDKTSGKSFKLPATPQFSPTDYDITQQTTPFKVKAVPDFSITRVNSGSDFGFLPNMPQGDGTIGIDPNLGKKKTPTTDTGQFGNFSSTITNAKSAFAQIGKEFDKMLGKLTSGSAAWTHQWSSDMNSMAINMKAGGNKVGKEFDKMLGKISSGADAFAHQWSSDMNSMTANMKSASSGVGKQFDKMISKISDGASAFAHQWSSDMNSMIANAKSAASGVNKELAKIKDVDVTITTHRVDVFGKAEGGIISAAGGKMLTTYGERLLRIGDNPGGVESLWAIPHNNPARTVNQIQDYYGLSGRSGGSGGDGGGDVYQTINLHISGNEIINERNLSKRIRIEAGQRRDRFV